MIVTERVSRLGSGYVIHSVDSEAMVERAHLVDGVGASQSTAERVGVEIDHTANTTVDQSHGRHHVWLLEEIQVETCADILLIWRRGGERRATLRGGVRREKRPVREGERGVISPRTIAATPSMQSRVGEEEYSGFKVIDREAWRGRESRWLLT
jgi:hypothetical protein